MKIIEWIISDSKEAAHAVKQFYPQDMKGLGFIKQMLIFVTFPIWWLCIVILRAIADLIRYIGWGFRSNIWDYLYSMLELPFLIFFFVKYAIGWDLDTSDYVAVIYAFLMSILLIFWWIAMILAQF